MRTPFILMLLFLIGDKLIHAQDIPTENVLLYLNFDNNELQDQSIYNHTVVDHQTEFATGINNIGLSLNGDGNYLEINNAETLEIPNTVSSSVWYRHGAQEGNGFYSLIEQSANEFGGHSRYGTWVFNQNQIMTCIEPDACSNGNTLCQRCITSNIDLDLIEWYHIVSTYDGQTLKIFINGELDSERTFDDVTGISVRPYPLTIGTDIYDASPIYLKGILDEIRLFNIALSDEQVEALYNEFNPINNNSNVSIDKTSIYPTLATDVVHIETTQTIEKLSIVNIQGQVIKQLEPDAQNNIHVQGLNHGLYFIHFTINGQVYTEKVFVVK